MRRTTILAFSLCLLFLVSACDQDVKEVVTHYTDYYLSKDDRLQFASAQMVPYESATEIRATEDAKHKQHPQKILKISFSSRENLMEQVTSYKDFLQKATLCGRPEDTSKTVNNEIISYGVHHSGIYWKDFEINPDMHYSQEEMQHYNYLLSKQDKRDPFIYHFYIDVNNVGKYAVDPANDGYKFTTPYDLDQSPERICLTLRAGNLDGAILNMIVLGTLVIPQDQIDESLHGLKPAEISDH